MVAKAGIFDLDGVITDTAKIHFTAWKRMFDEFLDSYYAKKQEPPLPFTEEDYLHYVDGKPRLDGIRSFFQSRHIMIPEGLKEDDVTEQTIYGLAKKKQQMFIETINIEGIPLFPSTITFINQLHESSIMTAVVSSSKNCQMILNKVGIEDLFETRVDGLVLEELGLRGKPQPDMFLEAAKRIHVHPCDAFIVEDALSGVQARGPVESPP